MSNSAAELIAFDARQKLVSRATVTAAKGKDTIRVRYLAGADGGRSFVRQKLGIDFPGKTLGVRAIVADSFVDGVSRDAWHRWGEGGLGADFALSAGRNGDVPAAGTHSARRRYRSVRRRADRAPGRAHRRNKDIVVRSVSWASAFNMNARIADRYRVGRAFLVGDAAHIHPPTGGQGLNTSVQDAYNLGWKIAAVLRGAPDTLLDTYEEERRADRGRDAGARHRDCWKPPKRARCAAAAKCISSTSAIPQSSLRLEEPAAEWRTRGRSRARCAGARRAGLTPRLFKLFQGPHWTLLAHDTDRSPIAPRPNLHMHVIGMRGDLTDGDGHFLAAYAPLSGTCILIRPDGYIGAIIAAHELGVIESYLADVGVGKLPHCGTQSERK